MEANEIIKKFQPLAKEMFDELLKNGSTDRLGKPKSGEFMREAGTANYFSCKGEVVKVRVADYQPNVVISIFYSPTRAERKTLDDVVKSKTDKEAERAALLARLAELDAEE